MFCRNCYREIPGGSSFCPRCGARQGPGLTGRPAETGAPAAEAPAGRNPWEDRGGRGWLAAFGETLQESLFRPVAFFRATAPEGNAGQALAYAVLVGTVSLWIGMMWQRVLGERLWWGDGEHHYLMPLAGRAVQAMILVALPFGVAVGNLVWAAVLHVSLLVLGGARGGYGTTLKAVCYSSSATAFNVLPVCGAPIGAVWQVIAQVIGLRELHRTSTARAFWAWFLPFVVALCLGALAAAAMVAGLMQLWQNFGGKFDV